MSDAQQATRIPWRKRHPVLSRVLLYVLGAGLVAGLVLLFLERRESDEATRLQALANELDALDLTHKVDPDGTVVLQILDERFSAPDLPVQLRGRALRWRALAHRKRNEREPTLAALREAAALDLPAGERRALDVDWAAALTEFGEPEAALERLAAYDGAATSPLDLMRAWARASALNALGRPSEGAAYLEKVLAGLPRPVATRPQDYVGGRYWTLADAAVVLTETLVLLREGAGGAAPWRRLRLLAPDSYDAHVAIARALLALRMPEEALLAWRRAEALSPAEAAAEAARDPALQALGEGFR